MLLWLVVGVALMSAGWLTWSRVVAPTILESWADMPGVDSEGYLPRPPRRGLAYWRAEVQKILSCQIPRRYLIRGRVKFPHPVGIVIGDGVSIGRGCEIYQNVTIGQQAIAPGTKSQDYPTIEDGVTIGAGAVVVGAIRIGTGAVIGANAVITKCVPPGATAFGVNRLTLSDARPSSDREVAP